MSLIAALNNILEFIDCDYAIEGLIIESGQRTVFKATDKKTGEQVVLKASRIIPVSVARIKREISILKEIDSEYFPKFFYEYYLTAEELNNYRDNLESGQDDEKIKIYEAVNLSPILITVEQFVSHVEWDQCAKHFSQNQKDFVLFLKELFNGLNILWEKKIVHRDLKPENILVRSNLKPTIIDLGIAKNMSPEATGITHHLLNSPCTPSFAAQEQLTNSKTEVTYKTDQFSVGIIAYLIYTKEFPYGRIDKIGVEGVVDNMKRATIAPISHFKGDISTTLDIFILKLLQAEPYKRFRTYAEIQQALDKVLETL